MFKCLSPPGTLLVYIMEVGLFTLKSIERLNPNMSASTVCLNDVPLCKGVPGYITRDTCKSLPGIMISVEFNSD